MKLAVIGEPCMDYIYRGNVTAKKQFGGILYSVVSLAVIAGKSAEIYPVMNLGEDEFENVSGFLRRFENINCCYVNKSKHKTRIVNLYYKDKNSVLNISAKKTYDREENSTEPTLPVTFEQMKGLTGKMNGILVNMVSGTDITLDTFRQIRKNFSGYIHTDIHNLVMQTFPDGTRKQMPVKNWEEWTLLSDTLQMNESELTILTGNNISEYETACKILAAGKAKALAVTRGRQGASIFRLKEKTSGNEKYTELDRTDIPMIENPGFVDSTGCGDVFASAFFYKSCLLNQADFNKALHFANRMAGKNASLHGVDDLYKLKII